MRKVLLLILDGFGIRRSKKKNAVRSAKMPCFDNLWKSYPHISLNASGPAVGLPPKFIGNSEVGHFTLGAGRVVDTDLVRINKSIKNGSFFKNKALLKATNNCRQKGRRLHLMGLLSDAGVHSHISHLFALLELAKREKVKEVYVHAFLDGRDVPIKSAGKYIRQLQKKMKRLGVGQLATIMGRFYSMDRDNRWKREHKAYDCLVNCRGRKGEKDPLKALKKAYARGERDEFVRPTILIDNSAIEKDDSVIFFNYRSDRARELTKAFVLGKFKGFQRKKIINLCFVSLTQYERALKVPVAFPPIFPHKTLGEVISSAGFRQLRVAETEKWAHVTYFFNGLCERIFPREDRILIPSIKIVKTYDKAPQMRVRQITDTLLKEGHKYDFFVVNFANGDMVGHTGNMKAAVTSVEEMDKSIGRIAQEFPGRIVITADHGNCEDMTDKWQTSHTLNKVPLIVVDKIKRKELKRQKLRKGGLADVAPTILKIMGIKQPEEMTGKSLF